MTLPFTTRRTLAPGLEISPVLNGMWQVSGAHGPIHSETAIETMLRYHDAGFVTWDLADHYGPAEDFVGEFRRRLAAMRGEDALDSLQALTKWVPRPGRMTREIVSAAIERSRRRMGVETIDLLQFHWWDYDDPAYLDALSYLDELRLEGKIRHLALTNFDTEHMRRIAERGIRIVANQVQYSLIDRRPEVAMSDYCREHDIRLLAYGSVCGGLLSERYLGAADPRRADLDTASLQKYRQMIEAWGGWPLFQELLRAVKTVAARHDVSMANVALRYVLERPATAGVIVGVRLGVSSHLDDNSHVFDFDLEPDDLDVLGRVLSQGRNLYRILGDCGGEYRG